MKIAPMIFAIGYGWRDIQTEGEKMQSNQALQKTTTTSPIFVEAEKLFAQMKEFSQSVANRAYHYFEARGRELGHELEDWIKAESDLMRHVPVEIIDKEKQLIVRAEVPGFKASEINVSFEPRFLTISGKGNQIKSEEAIYSERRTAQFCRRILLPTDVDPATATASLKEGILELKVAHAVQKAPLNVEVKASQSALEK